METVFKLLGRDILLFDGGMGTQLIRHLGKPAASPQENLLHPETILKIHGDYCAAGCDILTANTFGAYSGDYDIDTAVTEGVRLAKAATGMFTDKRRLVALDVGSLGEMIEPYGDLSEEAAYEKFRRLIAAGVSAGAELILIETMYDKNECALAARAARKIAPSLPLLITMTFNEGGFTFMGTTIDDLAGLAAEYGADAAGFNCGLGPRQIYGFLETLKKQSNLPIMTQPNAGMPIVKDGETAYDISEEEFSACIKPYFDKGVKIVGGCCGTTPAHIAALRRVIDTL